MIYFKISLSSMGVMKATGRENLKNHLEKAVYDAAHWKVVCEHIVELFGANGAILMPTNPDFSGLWLICTKAIRPALEQYIKQEWHLNDYRFKAIDIFNRRGYATDDDILDRRSDMQEIPFYRDLCLPYNVGFFIGIKIVTPSGIHSLSLYFDNDHPPIRDDQIKLIEEIRPLIEDATMRAEQMAHQKIADFVDFFSDTSSEVYILNPHGEHCMCLSVINASGYELTRPKFLQKEFWNDIYDELQEICASAPELSLSRSYKIKRNGKYLNLLAIQIPPYLRHYHMPLKVCLILTESCEELTAKHDELYAEFNLTGSEITTLDLLAAGNTVNAIAELLSLKPSSIRQRLKHIYEKTSVNSQIELVGLYNRL